jgi:hypothetical protein
MVGDAKCQPNHRRNTPTGPALPPKAIGLGPSVQEVGQAGQLLGREPAWGPRWRSVAEGLQPSCPGALHPLADGGFAAPQRFGDLALGPAFVLELPGLEPSGFLPAGR